MKHWLLILLLIKSAWVVGQQSVPVFSNKADSTEFAELQAVILTLNREPTTESTDKLDSLYKLQFALREKIIGYKTPYMPDKTFTSYDELASGNANPTSVTKLSVSSHHTKIFKNVIACTNLEELELVNTSVKRLPKKLSKLHKLKSIYIYNNQSRGSLKLGKNTVTKELLLRGMEAKALPKSYKKFLALEELDLSRNIGLSSFPDIYENKSLKKLNLIENNLTLADLKPVSNSSLTELNLQKNRIQKVPDAMGSFSAIRKLTFNYNEIAEVSPEISALHELEALSFYHNKLKNIPSGVYNLPALKTIDLYYNEIERIDPVIDNLKSIEILYLSNNQLVSIPDNISNLTSLRELYLSNNRLFTLPESLKSLNKITVLRVNNNKLTDFPEFVFELPSIENIDISGNNISLIPDRITALPNLNLFALSDNPLNKEEVSKIIEDLTAKGIVVHQNSIPIRIDNRP